MKMLRPFERFFRRPSATQAESDPLEQYIESFLRLPHHQWIASDKYLKLAFSQLFERMADAGVMPWTLGKVYFLPANAQYSCSLGLEERCQVIIVFPDLLRMLKALVPHLGLAVLAHELGHVFHRHYTKNVDTFQAQLEADAFAVRLGLGRELQDILLQYPESDECLARLRALTVALGPMGKDN